MKKRRKQARIDNPKMKWTKNRATELRTFDLPKSERWFNKMLDESGYNKIPLESNITFEDTTLIPDYTCKKYKFVIEIDGSVHENKEQKERDRMKDSIYKKYRYRVIRIIAYDSESFKKGLGTIFNIIRDAKTEKFLASQRRLKKLEKKNKGKPKKTTKPNKKRPERVGYRICHLCKQFEGTEVVFWKGRRFWYCQTCRAKVLV